MKKINKIISGMLISSMLIAPVSTFALTKDEVVYTNLGLDGQVEKTVVNNHIFNLDKGEVKDDTELKKLLNINGTEKFSKDGNLLTWNSTGKDIFYQGSSDKELPITVDVKYYLNGKEMSAKKMAGKKGEVKIRLSFKNNIYSNGLYTPFVVTMGTTLSNKENTNIEISNGKVVSTGKKSMAVALASPGLYESLGLDELKNLDEVVLSYKTTNFKLSNVYIISTPKLLSDADLSIFNKMDTLNSSLGLLQTNMNKAVAGAKELTTGTKKLASGADTISTKLNDALLGVSKLEEGSVKLTSGLEEIIASLEEAKQKLDEAQNNEEATEQMQQLEQLQGANTKMITKIKNNFDNDDEKITKAKEIIDECNLADEENELKIAACVAKKEVEKKVILTIGQLNDAAYLMLLENNSYAITTLSAKISDTASTIDDMLSELEAALGEARDGSYELEAGLLELKDGISKLSVGAKELSTGANSAADGTLVLSEGLDKLNNEGINKLSSYGNTAGNYVNKLKKLAKLSEDYKGYSSNSASNSTFIYKIRSISK